MTWTLDDTKASHPNDMCLTRHTKSIQGRTSDVHMIVMFPKGLSKLVLLQSWLTTCRQSLYVDILFVLEDFLGNEMSAYKCTFGLRQLSIYLHCSDSYRYVNVTDWRLLDYRKMTHDNVRSLHRIYMCLYIQAWASIGGGEGGSPTSPSFSIWVMTTCNLCILLLYEPGKQLWVQSLPSKFMFPIKIHVANITIFT